MKSLRDYISLVETEQVELEAIAQQLAEANAASGPTPQAAKALAKADQSQKQWVNGERYVYSDTEAGPQWVLDYSTVPGRQVGSTGLSGMFTKGTTQSRAANAYSGADSGAAAAGNVGAKIVNGKAVPPAAQAPQPKKTATPDPKVLQLQKDLIAKGAQIKADGIMGPKTQAAQKEFGQAAQPAAKPAAQPSGTEYAPFGGDTAPAAQAAQPAAAPAVPQNGQMAPDTVYTGQNPGIDDATRAAAMKAVGANPTAPQAAQPAQGQTSAALPVAPGARPGGVYAGGQQVATGQPYYGQDLSTMKVYKEDQALARIVSLANYK